MWESFSYDGRIGRILNKIADFFCLCLLWVSFSIPLLTIGASTAALYYTINKVLRNDRGSVLQEFWRFFKDNFVQSTIVWVIVIVVYAIAALSCYYAYVLYISNVLPQFFLIGLAIITALLIAWTNYLFPYIARFNNTTKEVFKNSWAMTIMNIGHSFLILVILIAALFVLLSTAIGIMIVPACVMLAYNFILEPVFRKYTSAEDLAAEAERNKSDENE